MIYPQKKRGLSAPVLADIANCELPAISWVMPDEAWSDHPGKKDRGLGPDWVTAIVNAIGESYKNSGGGCDYWGYPAHTGTTPEPTAVFITWDDWGGFYDHVLPPSVYTGNTYDPETQRWLCTLSDAPNAWGCGYVYGFRVPLLVVSEYTQPRTISGAIPSPGETYFAHDFGSILRFTEDNFNLPPIAPQKPVKYTFADQNTLDTGPNGTWVPLWDFFTGSPRSFTKIRPLNAKHNAHYFMNYFTTPQNGKIPQPVPPEDGDPDD
jgi:hypothetical protein